MLNTYFTSGPTMQNSESRVFILFSDLISYLKYILGVCICIYIYIYIYLIKLIMSGYLKPMYTQNVEHRKLQLGTKDHFSINIILIS